MFLSEHRLSTGATLRRRTAAATYIFVLARPNIHRMTSFLSLVVVLYAICNRIFNFSLALYLICHGPGVVMVSAPRGIVFVLAL